MAAPGAPRPSQPIIHTIVHEGLLLKRGEFIKNWRPRWFQLKSDGSFRGFKNGPPGPADAPLNFFDISESSITLVEEPKGKNQKFGFVLRMIQMTRVVDRSFHLDTEAERALWVAKYHEVKKKLQERKPASSGEPAKESMSLADFEMLKVLGKGTFGKVMLGKEIKTGLVYAIKVLKKEVILEKEELAHTMTENHVLMSTNHPFLTCLKGSFQTKDLLCFVMEYVNGGELFFHLSKERKFSEPRTKFYVAEITMAISYLHERGIIYRDLKLENLMLDRDGHVKITDFGLCKEEITFGATTTTFCGTPEYLAPEVLEDNDYGRAVDWWGMGVVMYEMICGQLPFYDRNHEKLFEMILKEDVRFPPDLGALAKNVLHQLLIKDPRFRLGGGEKDGADIMAHKFFSDINFEDLYNRKIPVPFKPNITGDLDTSNFDVMFTSEKPQISPTEGSTLAKVDQSALFTNFEEGQKR